MIHQELRTVTRLAASEVRRTALLSLLPVFGISEEGRGLPFSVQQDTATFPLVLSALAAETIGQFVVAGFSPRWWPSLWPSPSPSLSLHPLSGRDHRPIRSRGL